jgi:hypothetical protein
VLHSRHCIEQVELPPLTVEAELVITSAARSTLRVACFMPHAACCMLHDGKCTLHLQDCSVARSSSYRLRFIWVDGVYVLAPPLHVPRVPSPRMACPSAHAYALRLYRSARDLQLVDSCLLTDEVCGELSHRRARNLRRPNGRQRCAE